MADAGFLRGGGARPLPERAVLVQGVELLEDAVVPVWMRVLGVALPTLGGVLCVGTLLPYAGHTQDSFAWTMAPLASVSMGFFFAGFTVLGIMSLLSSSWLDLQPRLVALGTFLAVTLVGSIAHRDLLHGADAPLLARAMSFIWIPALALDLLGVLAVLVLWRLRQPPQPEVRPTVRAVHRPRSVRFALRLIAGAAIIQGVVPVVAPDVWDAMWPWRPDPLEVVLLCASALTVAVGLLQAASSLDSRQLLPYTLLLCFSTLGTVVGAFLFPEELTGPWSAAYLGIAALGFAVSVSILLGRGRLHT